jgi:hypothetical protein
VFRPELYKRSYEILQSRFGVAAFGEVLVGRVLYGLSAGTSHSAQVALAAMFKAACDKEYNFLEDVHEYERRAEQMKKIFISHGFNILYADD